MDQPLEAGQWHKDNTVKFEYIVVEFHGVFGRLANRYAHCVAGEVLKREVEIFVVRLE
jgi:hypothetical protein